MMWRGLDSKILLNRENPGCHQFQYGGRAVRVSGKGILRLTSALILYKMLTPVFELSQDDEFVLVIIKTPYVKVELDWLQVRT